MVSQKVALRSRLHDRYKQEIVPALQQRFGYANVMAVPKMSKVSVNMGVGEATQTPRLLDAAAKEMGLITGQKAVITRARQSISSFRLREGMPIGCRVTLRGERMYHFLDRLINTAIPRVRDFRGLNPNAFDGRGNYTLGVKEQLVFPEIDYDDIEKIRGMDITLVTTARTDEEARELLRLLGMPLRTA